MTEFTYRTGKTAMRVLEANGWTHIATVMSDQGDISTHFGMLYIKDDREFWRLPE